MCQSQSSDSTRVWSDSSEHHSPLTCPSVYPGCRTNPLREKCPAHSLLSSQLHLKSPDPQREMRTNAHLQQSQACARVCTKTAPDINVSYFLHKTWWIPTETTEACKHRLL